MKVIIPLEGLVDFDEEVKRINKSIEKLTRDIGMLSGKLSNEKFVANGEEDIQAGISRKQDDQRISIFPGEQHFGPDLKRGSPVFRDFRY